MVAVRAVWCQIYIKSNSSNNWYQPSSFLVVCLVDLMGYLLLQNCMQLVSWRVCGCFKSDSYQVAPDVNTDQTYNHQYQPKSQTVKVRVFLYTP
jgi:hypothetical protein